MGSEAFSQSAAQQRGIPSVPSTVVQPGFTVKITYSQKAKETLIRRKETVVVFGYIYGDPKQGTPDRYIDGGGLVNMATLEQEIPPGASATFDHVSLNQAAMKWADSQGPKLNINVASGRKSSPNNLLDCEFYDASLKAIQGQSIPIACKLIGE